MLPRATAPAALLALALALALGSCTAKPPQPDAATLARATAQAARASLVEDRKEDVIRQLSICESGGHGPSDRQIHGYRGMYLGRLQFTPTTVIGFVKMRDGVTLTRSEAIELAHDHERAGALAKFIIFDLEQPWHWPVCSRRLGIPAQMKAIKEI